MTVNTRPGNEPDPGDMAAGLDPLTGTEPGAGADTGAAPPAEDEAAKLGDFA